MGGELVALLKGFAAGFHGGDLGGEKAEFLEGELRDFWMISATLMRKRLSLFFVLAEGQCGFFREVPCNVAVIGGF